MAAQHSRILEFPGPAAGETLSVDAARRLRAMVDGHFAFIARVLRNLGVPESDLDDVSERVFSSAASRIGDIPPRNERAFLVQAAVRWAANARRVRARVREVACDELPDIPDGAPSPEDLTERRRAAAILDALLGTMDVALRAVFVLDEIEQMSRAEIAQVLGLPEGTVASRLRRAREDFELKLARWKREAGLVGGGVP